MLGAAFFFQLVFFDLFKCIFDRLCWSVQAPEPGTVLWRWTYSPLLLNGLIFFVLYSTIDISAHSGREAG